MHALLIVLEGARASTGLCVDVISSSVVSFAQFSPTCGRMLLPGLSLGPGRQPYRSRIVDGRRGGWQSSVAPRSRNPPTGRREIAPSPRHCFRTAHLCAQSVKSSPTEPVISKSSRKYSVTSSGLPPYAIPVKRNNKSHHEKGYIQMNAKNDP